MIKITIYDDFFNTEMTGIFKSEESARKFYAKELGTFPEMVRVVKITELTAEQAKIQRRIARDEKELEIMENAIEEFRQVVVSYNLGEDFPHEIQQRLHSLNERIAKIKDNMQIMKDQNS